MTTHEGYFRTYDLSVEQYGEILVAQAFHGTKMVSGNPGYDVDARIDGKQARIEVKSKLSRTRTGKATVVHCGVHKFGTNGMTHLLVILVDPEPSHPSIEAAWLLTADQAANLKRMATKSQYINVADLRKAKDIRPVAAILQQAANTPI